MNYFKESEFTCNGQPCFDKMDKSFLEKLDKAREIADIPFSLNSSWRSIEHNKKEGGSKTSSHLKGVAVDISVTNSTQRYEILKAILEAGFNRVGVADTFIHVDDDKSKYQNLIWTY